ncbi:MAG: hypothetical protein WAN50_04920 [Minisyncoccia bacterium]
MELPHKSWVVGERLLQLGIVSTSTNDILKPPTGKELYQLALAMLDRFGLLYKVERLPSPRPRAIVSVSESDDELAGQLARILKMRIVRANDAIYHDAERILLVNFFLTSGASVLHRIEKKPPEVEITAMWVAVDHEKGDTEFPFPVQAALTFSMLREIDAWRKEEEERRKREIEEIRKREAAQIQTR